MRAHAWRQRRSVWRCHFPQCKRMAALYLGIYIYRSVLGTTSYSLLFQPISVAIQRCNAVSFTRTFRMSFKVHILDAHLDKFKENMGAYSEEQGERFHRDIYWTSSVATKERITKTWWETTFGDWFVKVIYSIVVELEKLLTYDFLWPMWSLQCKINANFDLTVVVFLTCGWRCSNSPVLPLEIGKLQNDIIPITKAKFEKQKCNFLKSLGLSIQEITITTQEQKFCNIM